MRHIRGHLAWTTMLVTMLLCLTNVLTLAQDASPEATPEVEQSPVSTEFPTLEPSPIETQEPIPSETPTEVIPVEPTTVASEIPPTPVEVTPIVEVTPDVTVPPTEIPSFPSETAMQLVYSDGFASEMTSAWSLGSTWSIIPYDVDYVLRGTGTESAELSVYENLYDVAVQARVLMRSGAVQLISRYNTETSSYSAELHADGQLYLYRAQEVLKVASLAPVNEGQWHTLRLSVIGDVIRVAVDGNEKIAFQDPMVLPPGKLALAGSNGADFLLDDVQIFTPADQPPPPTTIPVPVTATLTPTPEATAEMTAEAPLQSQNVGAQSIIVVDTKFDSPSDPGTTLREAIALANSTVGVDTITFNIPIESSPFTIFPISCQLPVITDEVIIDGYTQPLASPANGTTAAILRIEIAGNSAQGAGGPDCPGAPSGLKIVAGGSGSIIRGLSISRFLGHGILIEGASDVTIEGNFIGLEVEGSSDFGNSLDGVSLALGASNNVIGGNTTAARNVISGNNSDGIEISGEFSTGNLIIGNYIGLDKGGLADRGNTGNGVYLNGIPAVIGGITPVERNIISGNDSDGVEINGDTSSGSVIRGNYIGLNWSGTGRVPNTADGVYITGSGNNTIGGTAGVTPGGACTGACNVITGNGGDGIEIAPKNNVGYINNRIYGNFIGLNPAGNALVTTASITGNAGNGIRMNAVAQAIIGTDGNGVNDIAERNIISGNQGGAASTVYGILLTGISAVNNGIYGNFIGTDSTGTMALGNRTGGIYVQSPSTFIGGLGPQYANVISGNLGFGIEINSTVATSNRIRGNYIGTSVNGMAAVPNGGDGVRINNAKNNFIGDQHVLALNIISGNAGDGIEITGIESEGNRVQINFIGTNANNTGGVPNTQNGVRISTNAKRNQIGLDVTENPIDDIGNNVIAYNGAAGVAVETGAGTGNSIMSNVIRNNIGLGIDLGASGVTANDATDADTGPNNLQNFPVLTSVVRAGGNVTIQAITTTTPNMEFRVDFFGNTAASCDPSSYGEGPDYLGSVNAFSNPSGTLQVSKVIPDSAFDALGADYFTMTVTDYDTSGEFPEHNTSEFSKCISRNNNPPTISEIGDQTTRGNHPVSNIPFVVGDVETAAGSLIVSGTSSNQTVVPNGNISFGGSGQNRTVTVFAAPGQGPATVVITVRVTDASGAFNEEPFTLTITPDVAPTIATIANQTTAFGVTKTVTLTVGDTDDDPNILTLSATSSNETVAPVSGISFGGSGTTRTITLIPATGQSGLSVITVTVSDGDRTAFKAFNFTVSANTAPTVSPATVPTQTTVTNTAKTFTITIGDAQTPVDSLVLSGTSNNTTLIPNVNITFSGTGTTRTVTLTPAQNQIGTTNLTINVSDGYATTSRTFAFTVNANVAPTLTPNPIPAQSTNIGTPKIVTITIGDAYTLPANLILTAGSSNTTLVPNANIVFAGTTASRTVTVTPANGQSGTTDITINVSDGDLTTSRTFTLTVIPGPNTPPTISNIADQSTTTNVAKTNIPFTVGDTQTPVGSLTVSGTSSNQTLVPNANIAFGGSGADRTVTITPATGQNGTATITITVTDGGSAVASDTFVFTVIPNTPPTISNVANQVTPVSTTLSNVPFTVGDAQTPVANLTVTGTSNNQTLIPNANIVFGGSGVNRTVTITPVAGQTGTATITVTVTDQGNAQAFDVFTVTVNPNQLPTVSNILDRYTTVDTSTGPIPFVIGDFETPLSSLTVSATSSDTNLVPNGNITFGGSGANRSVNVTPTNGLLGSTIITLTVTDSHSATATDTFTVHVTTNNPPTISVIADEFVAPNGSLGPILFTVNDPETPVDDLVLSATSSNTVLVPASNIVMSSSGAERTLTVFPASGQSGTSTIIVTVTDSANGSASESMLLTVRVAAPTLNTPANLSTVSTVKPSFNWTAVTGAKQYLIQVDDTSNFSTAFEINASTTTTTYAATTALAQQVYYWRVQALDALGNPLTDWSATPSFTVNILKSPANRSVTTDTTPAFSWNSVTGATYQLQVGLTPPTGMGFSPIPMPCSPTATTCTPTTPLSPGIYYWRVNVNGVLASVYSRVTVSPTTPEKPVLVYPANTAFLNVATPQLTWNATTSTSGPYTYEVQVDNQSTFASPEFTQAGINGPNPSTLVNVTLPDGLYSWRARAVNSLGAPGAWSLMRSFTVDTIAPLAPNLTAPVDNLVTSTTAPLFTWSTVTGASQYKLDVARDNAFTDMVLDGVTVATNRYTVPVANGLPSGTYYWRVQALDKSGNEGLFSTPRTLTVNILRTPTDGFATIDNTPSFTWSSIKPGTIFQLEIANAADTNFSNPLTVPASCNSTTLTTCTLTAQLPLGRYIWRVNINGVDAASYWTFIVSPAMPAAPVLLFPAVGGMINDSTPILSWASSISTLGTPYTYELQVDNVNSFNSPEYAQAGIATTSQTVTNVLPNGMYYWRVRTVNTYGAPGVWSATRTFTIDTVAPAIPTLKTPVNNAVLVDNTPILNWVASSGATRYRIDISRNNAFTDLVISGAQVSTVSYTVPNAYALTDGVYYWRVRALDAAGNISGPSLTLMFSIQAP
jgi:hypothetical protein